jgi:8-oxo-dGTP pyrophosphatase MutT (NUDIX family)
MDFDPSRPAATPRPAASVILLRPGAGGLPEAFLLRRHRKSSFMARSFVFPGGAVDPGEERDPRQSAARELFEEAGVLLAQGAPEPGRLADLRGRLAEGAVFAELLAAEGLALNLDALLPFSHWITPSAEKKRFSAFFYVALLPAGQTPSFDDVETVDEAWVTPADALERRAELLLPPPQQRTFHDLRDLASPDAVLELARARASAIAPIVPRFRPEPARPKGFELLLPWDPAYTDQGLGEGSPLAADHPFADALSRFHLDAEGVWQQSAPAPDAGA